MERIRKKTKKGIALLLTITMIFTLLQVPGTPVVVKAEDQEMSVSLGTGAISNPVSPVNEDDSWSGSYVYYGSYENDPVRYRVLDKDSMEYSSNTMLLDCDTILYEAAFLTDIPDDDETCNQWSKSDIYKSLNGNDFLDNDEVFSVVERNAISPSICYSKETEINSFFYLDAALKGEKIFILGKIEAEKSDYGYETVASRRKNIDMWWLRSAHFYNASFGGYVDDDYEFRESQVDVNDIGVSPAMNIDSSKILFTNLLSGKSGEAGAEYKLTLLDDEMNIGVAEGESIEVSGDTVTVPYTISGNRSGEATQVSVLILDKEYTEKNSNNAQILYYGNLVPEDSFSESGTGTFSLPANLPDSYYIYLLAEDINEGNETNYASDPIEITLSEKENYDITYKTNGGNAVSKSRGVTALPNPLPETEKYGYIFDGWYMDKDFTVKAVAGTEISNDTILYAKWIRNEQLLEYKITINGGAHGTTVTDKESARKGETVTVTVTPDKGYKLNEITVKEENYDPVSVSKVNSKKYTFTMPESNVKVSTIFEESTDPETDTPESEITTPLTAKTGLIYDGSEQKLLEQPGTASGGTIYYAIGTSDTTAPEESLFKPDLPTGTDAGIYHIWYMVKGDENHEDTTPEHIQGSISTRSVTLTSATDSKKYDGTALKNSEITVGGDNFVTGEGMTYDVTGSQTDAGNSKNTFEYTANEGTKASNYEIEKKEGTLTVTKRSVTLTSASDSKKYDGSALTNDEVTIGGDDFVTGEGITCTVTGSQTEVGSSKNTFTYILKDGTKESNYEITKTEGTLTVKEADAKYEITITASSKTEKYDGTEKTVSGYTINGKTGNTFTASNGKTYTLSGLKAEASGTNVGEYAVVVTGSPIIKDENNADVTSQFTISLENGKLTIGKRSVTLTSATDSKEYDGTALTNNKVTEGEDGFAEGEGAEYTVTGSRTIPGSADNTFTYKLNTNTKAENYDITTKTGTLTIKDRETKYEVTLTAGSKTEKYDGTEKTVSGYTIDGKTEDTFTASNGKIYTISGMKAEAFGTDAGEYEVDVTGTPLIKDENGNNVTKQFSVIPKSGKLTITKRSLTLTSASDSKKYDGIALKNDKITVGGDNFVTGEGMTYDVTGSQTDAGNSKNTFGYSAKEGTKASNYEIEKTEGTLTVTKRSVTLTSATDTKKYDGTALKNDKITVGGDKFVTGEGMTYDVTGSQIGRASCRERVCLYV